MSLMIRKAHVSNITSSIVHLNQLTTVPLTASSTHLYLASECVQVSGLQIHCTGAFELAGKAFSGAQTGDNTARGDAFNVILAVPSHKMTIVNVIRLSFLKLFARSCQQR